MMFLTFKHAVSVAAFSLCAQGAVAATLCTFTTECVQDESCAETTFSLEYTLSSCTDVGGPRSIHAISDFGDLLGDETASPCSTGYTRAYAQSFYLSGDGAEYLLSQYKDQAWLSVEMGGPFRINYLGTCEVVGE